MDEPSVFTRIINRELPATILFENERLIVIKTNEPHAPVHLLAITKEPYQNLDDLVTGSRQPELLWELFEVLAKVAREQGIAKSGYRLVANNGPDAGQEVPHLHVHLMGGAPAKTWTM